jgi:hypothetical protein
MKKTTCRRERSGSHHWALCGNRAGLTRREVLCFSFFRLSSVEFLIRDLSLKPVTLSCSFKIIIIDKLIQIIL